jgi:hypothetical protein
LTYPLYNPYLLYPIPPGSSLTYPLPNYYNPYYPYHYYRYQPYNPYYYNFRLYIR